MALNEAKAQSVSCVEEQEDEENPSEHSRRPFLLAASGCRDLSEANDLMRLLIREITRKVERIQDTHLEDDQLWDLNDEINNLIMDKRHLERRIVELGGPRPVRRLLNELCKPDYVKKIEDISFPIRRGGLGYAYFGAAKKFFWFD